MFLFSTQVTALLAFPPIIFAIFVLLNVVAATVLALKLKTFRLDHWADFLQSDFGIQKALGIGFTVLIAFLGAVVGGTFPAAFVVAEGVLISACGAATLSVLTDTIQKVMAISGNKVATAKFLLRAVDTERISHSTHKELLQSYEVY